MYSVVTIVAEIPRLIFWLARGWKLSSSALLVTITYSYWPAAGSIVEASSEVDAAVV